MTQNLPAQKTWEVKYQAEGVDIVLNETIIKNYLVRGKSELVTKQEMAFFMGICKARGLNPFAGDCYLIKYAQSDPAAIITSIDFKRSRAKSSKDCQGWKKGIVVQKPDGTVRDSSGLIMDGEKLIGGWFEATPKGWEVPFRLEVNLNGYLKKTSEGKITKFWQEDNQPTMIAKVAESQGLSAVWPRDLGKLYTSEEIGNEPQDITPLMDMENGKDWEGKEDPPPTAQTFIALVKEKIQGNKELSAALNIYLTKSADLQKKTTDQIMIEAAKDGETFGKFWTMFEKWHGNEKKREASENGQKAKEEGVNIVEPSKQAQTPTENVKPEKIMILCPDGDGEEKTIDYCKSWCRLFDGCEAVQSLALDRLKSIRGNNGILHP